MYNALVDAPYTHTPISIINVQLMSMLGTAVRMLLINGGLSILTLEGMILCVCVEMAI